MEKKQSEKIISDFSSTKRVRFESKVKRELIEFQYEIRDGAREYFKPIIQGEYFIMKINGSCIMQVIKLDSKNKKLFLHSIDLKEEIRKRNKLPFTNPTIYMLFKYLGEREVVEVLTGIKFKIDFFEAERFIYREKISADSLFKDQEYYEYIKNFLPILRVSAVDVFYLPYDGKYLEEYNHHAKRDDLKNLIQDIIKNSNSEFEKNYQKVVQDEIYRMACIDNLTYDFEKKQEKTKTRIKKKTDQ